MSSYISTYSLTTPLLQSILTAQSNLVTATQEVSTGTYANVGLELGAETSQDISLRSEESLMQTISDTNNVASTRLSSTQNLLSTLQSTAQDFLNTLVSTTNTSSGSALQNSASNNLSSLIDGLNTSVSGQYIFAGINTGTAPVTDGTSAVDDAFNNYLASQGLSSSTVSSLTSSQMQDFLTNDLAPLFQGTNWSGSSSSIWSSASDTTLTSQISESQSVSTSISANNSAFQDLAQAYSMVADLGTQNLSSDTLNTLTSAATTLVQQGITGLTTLQTNLGLVQNDVTASNNQMSVQMNILTTQINNLESVNPYQASTQVTDLQTQIETAYSLTSQLQKLSLVNYI